VCTGYTNSGTIRPRAAPRGRKALICRHCSADAARKRRLFVAYHATSVPVCRVGWHGPRAHGLLLVAFYLRCGRTAIPAGLRSTIATRGRVATRRSSAPWAPTPVRASVRTLPDCQRATREVTVHFAQPTRLPLAGVECPAAAGCCSPAPALCVCCSALCCCGLGMVQPSKARRSLSDKCATTF
jgi:hypothetical protein